MPRELSSDLGKRRIGFGHTGRYVDCALHGRVCGGQADSDFVAAGQYLPRFSAPILPMRCNTLIFSPARLGRPLPERFLSRLVGFADLFTRPTWSNVLVLLAGAILAPGRRTVSAVLRILGRECDRDFSTFHRILNRAAWSSRVAARQLLIVLVKAFVPSGAPVVIGLDDTIERRWGAKISARGIYRDPVRSSKGHFVKASGLRWLSAMLFVKIPWADRIMALPFLTLLAPSKRFYADKTRAPKTLLDWARQAALQIHRWLPDRHVVLVADSAFAAIEFLAAVRNHVCVVTRLRLRCQLVQLPTAKAQRPRSAADRR